MKYRKIVFTAIFLLLLTSFTIILWVKIIRVILVVKRSYVPAYPVITIESDDWGGMRGLDWGEDPQRWSRGSHFDCLESPEDVKRLSNMLLNHHDSRGRNVVITANVVFESISGDPINMQVKSRMVPNEIVNSWKEAMSLHILYPQLHALREADEYSVVSPDEGVRNNTSPYMLWDGERFVDLPKERVEKAVFEGQEFFYKIFGYKSVSTVPPRYLWGNVADRAFARSGISYVQNRGKVENVERSFLMHQQNMGDRTLNGLIMLNPRVSFEQARAWKKGKKLEEFVYKKVKEIRQELDSYQPAAISTHRANYVSCHSLSQAEYGIKSLDSLLTSLLNQYSDLLVLTAPEMGQLLEHGYFIDVFTGDMVKIPNLSLWKLIFSRINKKDLLLSGLLLTVFLVMLLFTLITRTRKN